LIIPHQLGGFTKIFALLNREEKELADQVIATINHFLIEVIIETAEVKEENTINAKLEETKRKPFKGIPSSGLWVCLFVCF
jgi:hypothetical protein